jgi:mono/diheme cytochrome c family protein
MGRWLLMRPTHRGAFNGDIPMKTIAVLIACMTSVAAMGSAQAQFVGETLKGREFARQICAECHAVEKGQPRSPNGQAPTFETIATTPGMTSVALTAALRTSHRTMPNLIISDDESKNVIAYVLSLR